MAVEKLQAEVIVEAKTDKQSFKNSEEDVKKFAKDTKKELDNAKIDSLLKDAAKLEIEKKKLQNDIKELNKELKELWEDPTKSEKLINLTSQLKQVSKETTEANRAYNNYVMTGDEKTSRLQMKFNSITDAMKNQNWVLGKLTWAFWNFWNMLKGWIWAAIWAIFVKSVQEIDVATQNLIRATWAVWENLKWLQDDTMALAQKSWISINQASQMIWELNTRLWITGDLLVDIADKFDDFSDVNWLDAIQQAKTLPQVMNTWWISIENTSHMLDLLTYAWQATWISIDSLEQSLKQSGAELQLLWFSFWEAIALFSEFEKYGISSSEIIAWMTKWISNLAKETWQTIPQAFEMVVDKIKNAKNEQEAYNIASEYFWKKAGVEMSNAIRKGAFDLEEFVEQLKKAEWLLEDTDERSKTFIDKLKEIGGAIWSDIVTAFSDWGTAADSTFSLIWDWFFRILNIIRGVIWTILNIFKIAVQMVTTTIGSVIVWISQNFEALKFNIWVIFENIWKIWKNIAFNIWTYFKNLWENIKIIFGNFPEIAKAAFHNMGVYLWEKINEMLKKIEGFINWAKNMLNKIPGVDIWDVSFKWVDVWTRINIWASFWIKDLSEWIKDLSEWLNIAKREYTSFMDIIGSAAEDSGLMATGDALSDSFWLIKNLWKVEKTTEDIKWNMEDLFDKKEWELLDNWDNEDKNKSGGSWWKSKTEKQIEETKELIETEEERNKRLKQELKDLEKSYTDNGKVFEKYIDASKKNVENLEKEIANLQKEIEKSDEKLNNLTKSRDEKLKDRYKDVVGEIDELNSKVKNGEMLWSEYYRQVRPLEEELKKIKELVNQDELDAMMEYEKLSKTDKILKQYEEDKAEIEAEKEKLEEQKRLLEEQKAEEEQILENFNSLKENLDRNYLEKYKEIESQITDTLYHEVEERKRILASLQDMAVDVAMAWWWSTTNNTNNNITQNITVNAEVKNDYDVAKIADELSQLLQMNSKNI